MKHLIAALFLSAFCLLSASAEAAGGLLLYTVGGSPYVTAVQYETFTSPSAHLSYVTVKGGGRTQIQSAGIIGNIPFPAASTLVVAEDAEAMIAQTDMFAARYPQYAQLLQSVGNLWKRSLEASKAQAAAEAKKRAEEDRVAAEKQKQEENRLAKEAETQRLAQVEQEQKAKKEEEQRIARLEEVKKAKLAEDQRLAEVEQDRFKKEAEKQRLAQIEADKRQKEDEIKRIAEEQRQAAQEIERQNAELAAITKKLHQQDSSDRTKAFVKLGVGGLILCAGIWLVVFAIQKCFDICSNVRERWRATLPPEERVIEAESSQTSPRDRKLPITGIALLLAGVACLVLPIAWLPTIFWVISPFLFAAGIIILHMLSKATLSHPAAGLWRFIRTGWFVVLYALLGISVGAASLVILAFGAKGPQFMRSGWNSADITEPAIISAVAQLSDSGVIIPSGFTLTPTESEAAKELSGLLITKNRLWVITRMKIEQAVSASDFAQTLSQAADRLDYWLRACSGIYERHQIKSYESISKLGEIGRRIADQSSKTTEVESQRYIAVLTDANQRFGSDPGVKKAIQELGEAATPQEQPTHSAVVGAPHASSNVLSAGAGTDIPDAVKMATKDSPYQNSLGMKFVPVPGTEVLFSVWDTRVKDFAEFVTTSHYDTEIDWPPRYSDDKTSWKDPGFQQTGSHPVVNVTHGNAKAFCKWLTEKERKEGKITEGQEYRLPTDEEWSVAVGSGIYPWGNEWPPPKGSGNYDPALDVDSYENTSPVGSFASNRFGLCDMGGNVWQWCEGWWSSGSEAYRFLRGGSCFSSSKEDLLSSNRNYFRPTNDRHKTFGFRCVLAKTESELSAPLLDIKTIQSFFGEEGFLPNLGDSLQDVARRLGVKVFNAGNHSYVSESDGAMSTSMSDACYIVAVGANDRVEGIAIHPRLRSKGGKILYATKDVRPLATSLLQALSFLTFQHQSSELVEIWFSNEGNVGVALRRFKPLYGKSAGKVTEEYSALIYGTQAGMKLITDNEYHCREPGKNK